MSVDRQFSSETLSPGWGLVSLKAGELRSLGLKVSSWPVEGNPAHCGVHGKKTKGVRKKMAEMAKWVVTPASPDPSAP